jgi:phosphate transport system permease protein
MEKTIGAWRTGASAQHKGSAQPSEHSSRMDPTRIPHKKDAKQALETVMHTIFLLCGIVAVAFVLFISVYLIISGVPAIRKIGLLDFLFGKTWAPTASTTDPSYGILPFILTSVYGTAGAVVLGVPVGLMTAIFLAKIAPPKAATAIHTAVELLAGIPSVVYGLVGMCVLVPGIQRLFGLSSGACLLAAILVLAVMILPSIVSVSETALQAVPKEYEEASLALGATKIETIFRVSVPAARSGVATAIVLGIGRAIGEAMAIIMVAGNVANMPGLFTSVRFLTTAIASEMSYAAYGSLQRQALFSIGLTLFLFIMLINVLLNVFIKNKREG